MINKAVLISINLFISISAIAQSPKEIINNMFSHADSLHGFIAEIKKTERFGSKYEVQVSYAKLNRNPFQVYLRQISPKEGMEVLLNSNGESKKAVINLNSFPWINLYLDPNGTLMRRNQHHLVLDSGFDLMIKILRFELRDGIADHKLTRKPDTEWKGRKMYQLELYNDDYKFINYQVKANDTDIDDIANRKNINAYMVLELNKEVNGYQDIEPNQVIKIPSHYAKNMILLIDQETYLPMVTKVYDEKGLYESYEYNFIIINPSFKPKEFTEDFDEYNF